MPTYYTDAPAEVADIAARLIAKHHPDVQEVETRITYKFAWAVAKDGEEEPQPPLKLHGVPCLALIRLVPYRNRVCGMDDVVVEIDGKQWEGMDDAERAALIDHELYHLVLSRDKEGTPRSDDAGRPKFKLRPHDFEIGGFWAIVERHRKAAAEAKAVSDIGRTFVQMELQWG